MRYWLCLTNLENWNVIKRRDIYGFNEQNKKYLKQIKKNDKIVMYVIPKKIGGIFEVINTKTNEKVSFTSGDYPYKIKLRKSIIPKGFVGMNEKIASKLKLFQNAIRWGTILMGRSIKELEKEDYLLFKKLIEKC